MLFPYDILGTSFFLSGRIVDKKTNEPVVGASVYIRKNQVGDNANDNGLYRIKLPQNGTYLVEVSFYRIQNNKTVCYCK